MEGGDVQRKITIICPVYNEEETIPIFYERTRNAISALRDKYQFEFIFTNNASEDGTLQRLGELHKNDPDIEFITLSRNFGYQGSILSGLANALGDAIIIIDVDCEDPPELIARFIKGWEDGYDIVYGRRDKRPEPAIVQLARKAFYRLTRRIADYDFVLDMAEFSLITARVREVIFQNRSTFPFVRTEIGFAGFKRLAIPYAREKRVGGQSHYNFVRMTQFAAGGILSSSTFPLRFASYVGFPLALANLLALVIYFWADRKLDFTSVVLMDFMYVIVILAFVSTYVARIYKDGVQRPRYIIDWANTTIDRNRKQQ